MSLKTSVSWSLVLSIILFGNIVVFGLVNTNFIFIYFLFSFLVLLFILYLAKDIFTNKRDIILTTIMVLLIAITLSYTADAFKANYDKSQAFNIDNSELISQIDVLSKTNDNAISYISSLQDQIKTIQTNTQKIQEQIDSINLQQTPPQIIYLPAPTPISTPTPIPTPINREEDDD